MEKKSSVYVNITDKTFQTGGTQELRPIIPMLTVKGELGLNRVTAQNFKDIVGYNLDYNANYLGLSQILSKVTYAYVWRLNQGASCGNICWSGSALTSKSNIVDISQFNETDSKFVVMEKSAGYDGDKGIKILPRVVERTVTNSIKSDSDTITVSISDFGTIARDSEFGTTYDGRIAIKNSYGDVVGVVTSDKKLKRVVNGSVGEECGTVTISTTNCTISINKQLSADVSWIVEYYSSDATEWKLFYGDLVGESPNYALENYKTYDFSLNAESDIYINKVSFGNLIVQNDGVLTSSNEPIFKKVSKLANASNGGNNLVADDTEISVADVDFSFFKTVRCNFLFTNGIRNTSLINQIIANATPYRTHVFVGTPDYRTYEQIENWVSRIHGNAYTVIGSVVDLIEYKDSYINICPSVKYCEIYANMIENYGSLNYPPAGHTYGKVSANELLNTDFDYYGNELKTKRINYLVSESNGVCMWEQRTMNQEVTDLSYIAPTFIVDDLQDQLVAFERNFNFRYQGASDLILQEEGLKTILDSFKNKGFLYDYTLAVPSVEEANQSRELDIYVGVWITKDSEIINLNITLNN